MTTKCAVGPCKRDAVKWRLCVPCALTWILTPEARLRGNEQRAALQDFITRQEVRHTLKHAEVM